MKSKIITAVSPITTTYTAPAVVVAIDVGDLVIEHDGRQYHGCRLSDCGRFIWFDVHQGPCLVGPCTVALDCVDWARRQFTPDMKPAGLTRIER